MTTKAQATAGAAANAENAEEARRREVGKLWPRDSTIPREAGTMQAHITSRLNNELSQHEKQRNTTAPLQKIYSKMEYVMRNVMGRKKSSDGDEIKPTLVTNLALNTTEVEKYRKVSDKVQLFQEKGPRMSALLSQLKGTSSILKLHKLPETDNSGNPSDGGQVGKLVHLHAELSTWMREESSSTLQGVDIICDRLSFAAAVLPKVACLRDQYIGLATKLNEINGAAKREFERHADRNAVVSGPASKRRAGIGGLGGGVGEAAPTQSSLRHRVLKAWDSTSQPARDGFTFISIVLGEEVVIVGDSLGSWLKIEKPNGSQGHVPRNTSSGAPRLEKIEEFAEASSPEPMASPEPADSEDDEEGGSCADAPSSISAAARETYASMQKTAATLDSTSSPPRGASAVSAAVADDAVTPGRTGPTRVHRREIINPWVSHMGGYQYTVLESGLTLWSNGTQLNLQSGVEVVICEEEVGS